MAAKQKVFGPYRVKNIGSDGDVWEVVEMVDNTSNTYQELRPRKTYINRQAAYGKCLRLNKQWQEQLSPEESDLLDYWKEVAN